MSKRNWVLLVFGVALIAVAGGVAAQNGGVDIYRQDTSVTENWEMKDEMTEDITEELTEPASDNDQQSNEEQVEKGNEKAPASKAAPKEAQGEAPEAASDEEKVSSEERESESSGETIEGVFTGQMDGHTVELKVDGEYGAFKLKDYGDNDEVSFSNIEVGEKVKVECRDSDDGFRTVITAVEVVE